MNTLVSLDVLKPHTHIDKLTLFTLRWLSGCCWTFEDILHTAEIVRKQMTERTLWLISARIQLCRETDERIWPGRKLLYGIIILWRTHCCIFSILQTSSLCVSYCVFGFQRQPVSHRCLSLDGCCLFVCVSVCFEVCSLSLYHNNICVARWTF